MSFRLGLTAAFLTAAFSGAALADPITIFSTGVDSSGHVLPAGSIDPHWTAQAETYDEGDHGIPSEHPATFVTDYNGATYVGSPAYLPTEYPGGGNGEIAWSLNNDSGYQAFVYRETFDLTGLDPATAQITLTVASDDDAELALNGMLIPSTYMFREAAQTFTLSGGFVDGLNTLDIVAYNEGGPGGVVLDIISATADDAVPEPASLALFGAGLAGVGFARRRRA